MAHMKLTFEPTETVAAQLQELARITQRPVSDLINDILDSPLDQTLGEQQDTDYIQLVILAREGVLDLP
jgi:hypothetical protein